MATRNKRLGFCEMINLQSNVKIEVKYKINPNLRAKNVLCFYCVHITI